MEDNYKFPTSEIKMEPLTHDPAIDFFSDQIIRV